jgi:hypothetical protein
MRRLSYVETSGVFLLTITLFCITQQAHASILTFDEVPALAPLPSNYGGFTWDANFAVYSDAAYASYGNTYGSPSGDNAVFNSSGVLSIMTTSGSDFDFNGAYFTGWAQNNSAVSFTATSITVRGYNNGNLIGTASMSLPANSYQFLNANLAGVDELRFISSASSQWWLMDNFTFNASVSAVPEASTLVTWSLLAVTGIVWAVWRRSEFQSVPGE